MKIWIVALVALASSSAFAGRMVVTCDEGKGSGSQFSAYVNFDPDVVQDAVWRKVGEDFVIATYKQGKADEGGTTTARVSVGFPSGTRRLISEYYTVNVFGIQNEDIARMFHGIDKDKEFDMTLSLSDPGLNASPKSFPAVLSYSPVATNTVYRNINLVCSALVRN